MIVDRFGMSVTTNRYTLLETTPTITPTLTATVAGFTVTGNLAYERNSGFGAELRAYKYAVNITGTGIESIGAYVSVSSPALPSVLVPIAGLPPVYLVSSVTLSLNRSTQLNALPPYNIILANLDTGLNENPLGDAVVGDLSSDGHYPIDGLFGVYGSSAISLFDTDDINVAPNLVINHIAPITLQSGGLFTVALAAPAYGYFQGDSLIDLIAYSSGRRANFRFCRLTAPVCCCRRGRSCHLIPEVSPLICPSITEWREAITQQPACGHCSRPTNRLL